MPHKQSEGSAPEEPHQPSRLELSHPDVEPLRLDQSLDHFELNTVLFPDSSNTWDSLAEAHAARGDQDKAKALYEKARRLAERAKTGKRR